MHISSSWIQSISVCTCRARVILPRPPARQSTLSWVHIRPPKWPSAPKAFSELLVKRIQLFDSAPLLQHLPPPPTQKYHRVFPSITGRLESGAAFLLSSSSRPFRDSFLPFKQVVVVILYSSSASRISSNHLPFPKRLDCRRALPQQCALFSLPLVFLRQSPVTVASSSQPSRTRDFSHLSDFHSSSNYFAVVRRFSS